MNEDGSIIVSINVVSKDVRCLECKDKCVFYRGSRGSRGSGCYRQADAEPSVTGC